MFRNIRKTIVSLLSAFTLAAVPLAVPTIVSAAASTNTIQNCLGTGSNLEVPSGTDCNGANTGQASNDVEGLITTIINIFSWVVGVIAVIMIIVGGFRYISSGGDSNKITAAKNTIIYAIIGLVIVALAQIFVQFVLNKTISATNT